MGIGQTSHAWIGEQQENVISSSQRKIVNHCGRLADDGPGERVFFFYSLPLLFFCRCDISSDITCFRVHASFIVCGSPREYLWLQPL